MKNIYKIILGIGVILGFASCENNDDFGFKTPEATFEIETPQNGNTIVIDDTNMNNVVLTIVWELTGSDSYTVEFAKAATNFAEPFVGGVSTTNNMSWTNSELNTFLLETVRIGHSEETAVEARIKDATGDYSNVITLLVTPFNNTVGRIAVPGNHQGWSPSTASQLEASSPTTTDYEGYVWLDGEHKFVGPDANGNFDWGNTDWGDNGSFNGILVVDGEVNCTVSAGYYYVQVDTVALTYSETNYSTWGVIGSATPTGWDSDTDLIYDPATQTWSVTLNLTAEEFKFRANNAWDWDYGDNGADGYLENGGANIAVPAAGNYTITLDLSVPRAYTYTLTLN